MKVKANVIDELLSPLAKYTLKNNFSRKEVDANPPLRAELFSTEQMEQHALQLAAHHTVTQGQSGELLLKELSENEKILFHVNDLLQKNVKEKKVISPAAEWLLDNFYLIDDQITIAKRYLPKGYSKGLPKLETGPMHGFPRIYSIAIEIISHNDGHIDIHGLRNFITAYQKERALTLGELWAFPIMLRLALIENLSRVAARIAVDKNDSALANKWAQLIIDTAEDNPKDLVLVIADMARSKPPMVSAFIAEFARKLQWKGMELTLPLHWLEQQLSESDDTINSMILLENQHQAADQVSVSNSINSLRFLAKTDWRDFVENMSIVDSTLRNDALGVYAKMDFQTRDQYRHTVEEIASNSGLSESDVARIAVDFARKSFSENKDDLHKAHVGYYLLDKGVELTEKETRSKLPLWKSLSKSMRGSSGLLYTITAVLATLMISCGMLSLVWQSLTYGWLILIGILSVISASYFAVSLANWWSTLWIKPKPLPKLDFSSGIADESRTLVIIPTLLTSTVQIEKLVEELEVRFLSNRDPNLLFGLLTDFTDASQQNMPEDEVLLQLVQKRISELNQQYNQAEAFFLFHRPRVWNAKEKVWMGYERKRGKLGDLNRVLRGKSKDCFSVIVGNEHIYTTVKYVITLDTDTQLPREAAWKLVGIMAHPLNQPVFDEKNNRVIDGYGIIQPRIAISLHGATRSFFTRLHESDSGIDPYTRVTSDVYQDLFGEGSFIGKGIYDVDAFEKVLTNRFPENRILSHDLLEGSYARCGFASDVQFYEEYPSRYQLDINRRRRWIRGDWQIGNWFLPVVPGVDGRRVRNPLSGLSKWKIFDNLRRSLIPIANLFLLIASWSVLPYPLFWTLIILGIMLLPSIIISLWSSTRKPKEIGLTQHINNTVGLTSKSILQSLFGFVCLPYEAYVSAIAILRTLWRVNISRRNLLEWNSFGLSQNLGDGLLHSYKVMWVAPSLALGLLVYIIFSGNYTSLVIAIPLLVLWFLSPSIVTFLDQPITITRPKLNEQEKAYLRELSRKSWAFFENFVGVDDNWLPPDNLQQYPIPIIAHRTSPTNIGLSLLSNLSARDFGYSTTTQLIERIGNTFTTMQKLERYQGHFYNWYDTQSLVVLSPRYVSTVDSGNLAAHLLTLRQGLLTIPNQKILDNSITKGLQDTLRLTLEEISSNENGLRTALQLLHDGITDWELQPYSLKQKLEHILQQFEELIWRLPSVENWWRVAFKSQVNSLLTELKILTPWVSVPVPDKFKVWKRIDQIPTLAELATLNGELKSEIAQLQLVASTDQEKNWLIFIEDSLKEAGDAARRQISQLETLAAQALDFSDMEYDFLYDKSQRLLSIGYQVTEHHRDASYYDLLASEARLSSFVAIAQGKIPQESWFALGRRLTNAGNTPVLLSWSGSMFEYLMPGLVMPTYENTLLDEMNTGTVIKQIEYGEQHNVPWGISESCYNLVDAHLTYQYRAFGIPGLGFKRGLGQDLVIAPYATVLALMANPKQAYENLQRMRENGFEGKYGFYEAIDYTPTRLARNQQYAIIKTFMAHHQGMSLLSLAYVLLDRPMQKRFEADTQFQTALLLLQEQVPKSVGFYSGSTDHEKISVSTISEMRVIRTANTPVPEVQLLSNGRYFAMLSNAGGGYSRWKDIAVTRWREDTTCDNWGMFCYIHDKNLNQFWSVASQPTTKVPDWYEAIFSQGKVEYRRRDGDIETYTTVIVSPEDDVEVRRIHLMNLGLAPRNLSITSYGEVVLAAPDADDTHATFSNLFVQTEINAHQHAIVCTRRPRSKEEQPPWMFHLMKVSDVEPSQISFETDRSKFIGRGHTLSHPKAINQKPLSGSQGSVLDPIVSIQYNITVPAGETALIDIVTGIAETKEVNQSLIDKYQDKHLRDRAFELSWTHSQVVLRQIGATEADAQLFGKLASSILYANSQMRAQPSIVLKNQRQQSALWSYSISGDLPIVLLIVSEPENIFIVRQLIKAKVYWQMKGLFVDLVILNEDPGGYRQVLQDQIQGLVAAGIGAASNEKQGRIFVRQIDQVSGEDRILFQTVARVIISDKKGSLEDQVNKLALLKPGNPKLIPAKVATAFTNNEIQLPSGLQYFNGTGGFSADGKEYVIFSDRRKRTPLPWINVLANPTFGAIVSESGSSYTWFENAHEYRITPWKNDPLLDSSGEALYIRDEDSGRYWSPLGLPTVGKTPYVTRHGFGYSNFQHVEEEILSDTTIHVDKESPVKFISIKLTNQSGKTRKVSVTGYVEWVLGELRSKTGMHIVTEFDQLTRTIIAKNRYSSDFRNYVTFFGVSDLSYSYTTDRAEFIGRNGTLHHPDAMTRAQLGGKSGACLDACAAIMVPIALEPGNSQTIVFKLGAGKTMQEVQATLQRYKENKAADQSFLETKQFWSDTLENVEIETPDSSINILANGWLLYQVLSSRLWGRSGLYQSGGAFGFRDQLQDTLALIHTKPSLTKQQIMRCASRQFREGDVQHWWHPPSGRGVRTLCSDDYLWLPFVTSQYVLTTGDSALLNEQAPFLEGRKLNVDEESYYDLPITSDKQASVYEHCKEAIVYGLRFGEHGLPLIGSGDWNDGMNMVGIHGKGESIWLAFFLYEVLNRFIKIATLQEDHAFVAKCEKHARQLKNNINEHGWDGQWYLRAYFDDGTPLGSAKNEECKIDAISQSWSVLSEGGELKRSRTAMQAVDAHLINREKEIIQLLEPPFDKSEMDPGYIKGYVPGVRENGGQYSHAAIWMVMAFAKLEERERTAELIKMINPIHHGATPEGVEVYKTEPYVMAADVYGVSPHTGRGGWTWYTGSAGWMYQLILESFLGMKREADTLTFNPCIPETWQSFTIRYRYYETLYTIRVVQDFEEYTTINLDGVTQHNHKLQLVNDQQNHDVIISLGDRKDDADMERSITKSVEKTPKDNE